MFLFPNNFFYILCFIFFLFSHVIKLIIHLLEILCYFFIWSIVALLLSFSFVFFGFYLLLFCCFFCICLFIILFRCSFSLV